jgi:hypothetical protein
VADAAFTGFRIVWQRPLSLLFWTAVQLVVSVSIALFITVSSGANFTRALGAMAQLNADPAQSMAHLAQIAPTILIVVVVSLVLYAVLYAAMNRAVLRPDEWRFGYLRLASDELRQLGLFALLFLLAFLAYLGVVAVAAVIVALLTVVAGDAVVATVALLLIPIVVCVFTFLGVRFSLASPLTFERGRIDLLGSWRLTKGRFWPLLWTYLLALGLSLVVQALVLAITVFAVAIAGGGFSAIGQVPQSDFTSIAAELAPVSLVNLLLASIGQALSFPVTMSPPAAIYRALTAAGGGAAKVFD